MIDIQLLKTRLALLALDVTGIKKSYANKPKSLGEMCLPCAMVTETDTAFNNISRDGETYNCQTTFNIMFYLKLANAGYDETMLVTSEPARISAVNVYKSHPALGDGTKTGQLAGIFQSKVVSVSSIGIMKFEGIDDKNSYLGFTLRLSVVSISKVEFAKFE